MLRAVYLVNCSKEMKAAMMPVLWQGKVVLCCLFRAARSSLKLNTLGTGREPKLARRYITVLHGGRRGGGGRGREREGGIGRKEEREGGEGGGRRGMEGEGGGREGGGRRRGREEGEGGGRGEEGRVGGRR